jgi:hypothetical protein
MVLTIKIREHTHTLKPGSSKLGTFQAQNFLYLGPLKSISELVFSNRYDLFFTRRPQMVENASLEMEFSKPR